MFKLKNRPTLLYSVHWIVYCTFSEILWNDPNSTWKIKEECNMLWNTNYKDSGGIPNCNWAPVVMQRQTNFRKGNFEFFWFVLFLRNCEETKSFLLFANIKIIMRKYFRPNWSRKGWNRITVWQSWMKTAFQLRNSTPKEEVFRIETGLRDFCYPFFNAAHPSLPIWMTLRRYFYLGEKYAAGFSSLHSFLVSTIFLVSTVFSSLHSFLVATQFSLVSTVFLDHSFSGLHSF